MNQTLIHRLTLVTEPLYSQPTVLTQPMQKATGTIHKYPLIYLLASDPGFFFFLIDLQRLYTVEPRYNEVLGTMKITLLYQVSHYIRVQNKEI